MENLINIVNKDGKAVVSSRVVAEDFGKKHKHVLDTIGNYIKELNTSDFSDLFIESEYKATNGKMNKEYLLTRDGFSLVVMGFTGSDALQWKLKYINAFNMMEQQLKQVAIQSPQAFVDSLSLTEYAISKYLPNFLTWKNVDEVMPRLIERVTESVDTGDIKLGVLSTTINVAKAVRDAYPNSAEKEIMTRYIEDAQAKYDRVLIASKAGITKANNDLRKQLEDKEKEIAKAETKRLKDFSDKALIKAYKESGIIGDLVDDHVKCVMDDELYKLFVENLENIIRQIVKHSGNDYRAAHMMVYNRMGIHSKGRFNSYTEYIFYNQWEMKCLQVAADILEKYL